MKKTLLEDVNKQLDLMKRLGEPVEPIQDEKPYQVFQGNIAPEQGTIFVFGIGVRLGIETTIGIFGGGGVDPITVGDLIDLPDVVIGIPKHPVREDGLEILEEILPGSFGRF